MFIKDKNLKKEKIVKVRIKEGINEIDGLKVVNGYVELPENIAIYKIAHKPYYYLEIIEEKIEEKEPEKIEVPNIKEIKKKKEVE